MVPLTVERREARAPLVAAELTRMSSLPPGVTKAGEGLDNISWNILGQTYVPKAVSEDTFAWHATFPPDTFVPPHIHPTQDEFIYMFEGRLELMIDGRETFAVSGDLVRMPRGLPHGIFNKSGPHGQMHVLGDADAPALRSVLGHSQHGRADAGRSRRAVRAPRGRFPAAAGGGNVGTERLPQRLVVRGACMTVLIAGGGIGGLTLALMLHRRGIKATVFEQASEIREVGVGINTLPHAIKELAALGLLPALDAAAIRTKELIYVNRLGQKVWQEKRGLDAGFDYPQFSIHRGRLQKMIHDAVAQGARARTRSAPGSSSRGFFQDEGGVTAHFVDSRFGASSETVRGEVLVGADGIHSRRPPQVLSRTKARRTGRARCSIAARRNGRNSSPAARCISPAAWG